MRDKADIFNTPMSGVLDSQFAFRRRGGGTIPATGFRKRQNFKFFLSMPTMRRKNFCVRG